MVLAFQGASMMQVHGRRHGYHRSMILSYRMVNGFGLIQHIPWSLGYVHHIRSEIHICLNYAPKYDICLTGLRRIQPKILNSIFMYHECVYVPNMLLDISKGAFHHYEAFVFRLMDPIKSSWLLSGLLLQWQYTTLRSSMNKIQT